MSVAGIICEYNPFHEGHKYHIRRTRELTGADTVVAVMNGDFVQRGEPAIVDKYTRAAMALAEGADLVFELPVRYGISSAEDFAYGGILALESLSFVDYYCFGSECGDLDALKQAGRFFAREAHDEKGFSSSLAQALKEGLSYPAARERAFWEHFQGDGLEAYRAGEGSSAGSSPLFAPNNILGIEYIKAAEQLHSRMEAVTVPRLGMGYHDTEQPLAGGQAEEGFRSAAAIRENMRTGQWSGIPAEAMAFLRDAGCCLASEDFWTACAYAIRLRWGQLEQMKDVSDEIANRFRASLDQAVSLEDFVNRCKTKNITMSRIRRCVFQVLLGVGKEAERERYLPYIRLLAMRGKAAVHLKQVQDTVILARLSRDKDRLQADSRDKLEQDILASDIYRNVAMSVSGKQIPDEYKRPLITS